MSRHPDGVETLEPGPAEEAQCRVAGALDRLGIGRGDRVVFCLESSASLLVCVLGAARRGVVPVLLNATLLAAERAALIADAEPALVVSDPSGLTALLSGPRRRSGALSARASDALHIGDHGSTQGRVVRCAR